MGNINSRGINVKISVIIPVYNTQQYLSDCLQSVLSQTFDEFEVICVNDGSTDKSAEILNEYTKKDSRIKIITQENKGLSEARNRGIKDATGEYIYFLDSDDQIHPQCFEIAYEFAKKHNAELVCWDYEEKRNEEKLQNNFDINKIKFIKIENPVFQVIKQKNFRIGYNVWSKLYRKNLLDNIDFIPNISFEDYPHTFAVLAQNPLTVILDAKLYLYRITPNSLSHRDGTLQQIKDYETGIKYVLDVYDKPEKKNEFEFLKKFFIPNILKHQLGRCRRADQSVKNEMFREFAKELRALDKRSVLSWRGHKFTRYLTYKWIMRKIK